VLIMVVWAQTSGIPWSWRRKKGGLMRTLTMVTIALRQFCFGHGCNDSTLHCGAILGVVRFLKIKKVRLNLVRGCAEVTHN
jgi:hypothetical protein